MNEQKSYINSSGSIWSTNRQNVNQSVLTHDPQLTVTVLLTDFPNILLTCLGPVIAMTSMFLNGCLLSAVGKVSHKELKSKFFLINALVVDVLFPLSYTFATVLYVAVAFGLDSNYQRACLDGVISVFSPTTQYVQTMSSLILVLDRLYAIVLPLQYHIKAYQKMSTVAILSGLWIISLGLVAPVLVFAKRSTGHRGLCYGLAEQHKTWNNVVRFPIIISISCLVFVIYAFLFIITKWNQSKIKAINKSHQISTKESVSLAMTFFAVHLSTLGLFIPGPMFAMLVRAGFVPLSVMSMWRIRRALILLYLSNSLVDPVIMATRIPAIKAHLLRSWNRKRKDVTNTSTTSMGITLESQDGGGI